MRSSQNTKLPPKPQKISPNKNKGIKQQPNLTGRKNNQIYNQNDQGKNRQRRNSNQRAPLITKKISQQQRSNYQLNCSLTQDEEDYHTQQNLIQNQRDQGNNMQRGSLTQRTPFKTKKRSVQGQSYQLYQGMTGDEETHHHNKKYSNNRHYKGNNNDQLDDKNQSQVYNGEYNQNEVNQRYNGDNKDNYNKNYNNTNKNNYNANKNSNNYKKNNSSNNSGNNSDKNKIKANNDFDFDINNFNNHFQQSQDMIQDSLNQEIQNQERQKKRLSRKKITNKINLQDMEVNDISRITGQQRGNFNSGSKKQGMDKVYNQQSRQNNNRTAEIKNMNDFQNGRGDRNRSQSQRNITDKMNLNDKMVDKMNDVNARMNIKNRQNNTKNANESQSNRQFKTFDAKQGNGNNNNIFEHPQIYKHPEFTQQSNKNHQINRSNRMAYRNNLDTNNPETNNRNYPEMNQKNHIPRMNYTNNFKNDRQSPETNKNSIRNRRNQQKIQRNQQIFYDNQKYDNEQLQQSDSYNNQQQCSNQNYMSFKPKKRFGQAGQSILNQTPRHSKQRIRFNPHNYEQNYQYQRRNHQHQHPNYNQSPYNQQKPGILFPRLPQVPTGYPRNNNQFPWQHNSPFCHQQGHYNNPAYFPQYQYQNFPINIPPHFNPFYPVYNNNNVNSNGSYMKNENINGLNLPAQEAKNKNNLQNRIIHPNNKNQQSQKKLKKDQQLAQLSQQNNLINQNKLKQQVEQLKKKLQQNQNEIAKLQQKQKQNDSKKSKKDIQAKSNQQSIKNYQQKNSPIKQSSQLKSAQQSLLCLLKFRQEQFKFNQVLTQIQEAILIDDIALILSNYTGKGDADKLAKQFYKVMGKEAKSLSKIQEFYHVLRIKKIPGETINQIKLFVTKGRKQKIKELIIQKIGAIEGEKLFYKYQEQFPKIDAQPLIGSKKIRNLAGLDIYEYPTNHISAHDQILAKTLIVLGQTGSGKSTFLNSLVNYLAGVQLQDPFRYFIIIESTQTQINSITSKISIYFIKDIRTGNCYRVIDTPGFGDTNGLEKDQQTVRQIQTLFKTTLDSIHLVLFLVKSSTTRVTQFHRYIFQSVMALFDKSIAENFVFVCTFADASQPVVLESIKDSQSGFGLYWNRIKQPKVIQVNNSGFFQKPKLGAKITAQFWKIGFQFMSKLIAKAEKIQAKSLIITKELIRKKQQLSTKIKATAEKIQHHVVQQQNIRAEIQLMIQNEDKMKRNEQFQFQVDHQVWYAEEVEANVTRCNNCMNSNCHANCAYGDGAQKKNCSSMDGNGNCTVCPGKCHYANHTNSHIIRKQRTVKKKITNDQLKLKYNDAKGKLSWYQNSIQKMLEDLQNSINSTKESLKEMTTLQKQLQQISMSKSKPQSTKDYILFLIQGQNRQRKVGYLKKIQSYHLTLQQLQVQQNTLKGKTLDEAIRRKVQLLKSIMKNQPQQSTLFNRFKKFLGI